MTEDAGLALERAKDVKCVIFDIDGVLTDGALYYGADGEMLKRFNVKDGVGIKLLRRYGIEVAVISAKSSAPLQRRLNDLGIQNYYLGLSDKLEGLSRIINALELKESEIAYVGDDVIDISVMLKIGLPIAVADAYGMVKDAAILVTEAKGGCGVAREVADFILGTRGDLVQLYRAAMLPEFEKVTPPESS